MVHPDGIETSLVAAKQCNISTDRIILIDRRQSDGPTSFITIQSLVNEGLTQPASFVERRLSPGEGRTKVAFLCTSSGTTGRPKVSLVALSFLMCIRNKPRLHRL